jgi:hypothetical protein
MPGRFSHESLAIDPLSGNIYQTEDAGTSPAPRVYKLQSFPYRYSFVRFASALERKT